MQKITTFLWYDNQAEDAASHYTSIFTNSKIIETSRQGGKVLTVTFELDGQRFIALNGGPLFTFSEAMSLLVSCESQEEVDHYWDRLSSGGTKSRCGWLKDKFGVSWQVIPTALNRLASDPNPTKSKAVIDSMMKMSKIVVADLERAYATA